ncbi:MAG: hypothetical protein LBF88_07130 [Planctomycetaceae bacterium]|jgi:hypothetical protein|nr:hypothetical protein [Planctomycetaceae bacterium]
MQTRINGTLTLRNGRRTFLDGITIGEAATVHNDAEIHAYTVVSQGTIAGSGTLWAHITSRPIGGVIDTLQVIIYYPVDKSYVLPIVFGALYSSDTAPNVEGSLT